MGRIPQRHRRAFNKRMQKEAGYEQSASNAAAKSARRLAAHNPGIIFRGGGVRILTLPNDDEEETALVKVTLKKHTTVSNGGMIKTNSYSLRREYADGTSDTERFRRRDYGMQQNAEEAFEDAVPEYESRFSISIPRPNEAPLAAYLTESVETELTIPDDLR